MSNIFEGFTFVGENTADWGLRLMNRSAPSPEEKFITERLPFVHGEYDFSTMLGERIFENRRITYTFHLHEGVYANRKIAEVRIKQWLMKSDINPLYDTHSKGFYWLGKFISVTVDDITSGGMLIVNADFWCYPFMMAIRPNGHDIWDDFNFELGIAQDVSFIIQRLQNINIWNVGDAGVVPTITTTSPMTIIKNGVMYTLQTGTTEDDMFRLEIGENPMTIHGNGSITFTFHEEVMG